MKKNIISIIFFVTRLFPQQTLSSKSWNNIRKSSPKIYKLRGERRKYHVANDVNSPIVASLVILFLLSFISFSCLFSWNFTGTALGFFNFIKLGKDNAKQLITDSLMATATISALSFVVVNFLLDKVKNANHETYQTLFRVTRLYYALLFVLIGFVILVFLNLLKHTPKVETLGNMALWSVYLSISIVVVIILLFFSVLRFLNPQSVTTLSKNYLLSAAKFHRLDERFFEECNKELLYIFESKGFIKESPFQLSNDERRVISLVNLQQGVLFDVHLPIINNLLDTIKENTQGSVSFLPVRYRELLNKEHAILKVSETTDVGKLRSFIWPFAIWLKPIRNQESNLTMEKNKMFNSLVQSAKRGDTDGVKTQFDIIRDLYNIYYETK